MINTKENLENEITTINEEFGLEEENDIKTGLIVSNSLHAYYLADWANDFANIYVNKYIKENPVTVSHSNTDELQTKI